VLNIDEVSMEVIVSFILGVAVGVLIVLMFIKSAVREALESADNSLDKLKELVEKEIDQTVQTRIEEHHGVYYLYNVKDGAFLGQGATLIEIKDCIAKRLPNTNVNIIEGDTDVIKKLQSELKAN
jgi:hypothetical protein